jgi:hypothetical protein
VGVTVAPERRYLHLASLQHQFEPVAIGSEEPPVQLYELYNAGQLPLEFEFDQVLNTYYSD